MNKLNASLIKICNNQSLIEPFNFSSFGYSLIVKINYKIIFLFKWLKLKEIKKIILFYRYQN